MVVMFEALYSKAAAAVIAHLLTWIGVHDPGRTEPLTWPETTSNVPHMANDGNRDAIEMIIISWFPENADEAMELLACENPRWDPRAVSRTSDYGLFQLNRVHWRRGSLGEGMDPFDVVSNVQVARWLYDGHGQSFRPWTCSR